MRLSWYYIRAIEELKQWNNHKPKHCYVQEQWYITKETLTGHFLSFWAYCSQCRRSFPTSSTLSPTGPEWMINYQVQESIMPAVSQKHCSCVQQYAPSRFWPSDSPDSPLKLRTVGQRAFTFSGPSAWNLLTVPLWSVQWHIQGPIENSLVSACFFFIDYCLLCSPPPPLNSPSPLPPTPLTIAN